MKIILLAATLCSWSLLAGAEEPIVLGHLETRARVVTIYAGEPAVYAVRTKEGKVVAEKLTTGQFAAKFPELHRIVEFSVAGANSAHLNLNPRAKRILDASVR